MGFIFLKKLITLHISFNPLQFFENIVSPSTLILPSSNYQNRRQIFGNIYTLQILLGTVQQLRLGRLVNSTFRAAQNLHSPEFLCKSETPPFFTKSLTSQNENVLKHFMRVCINYLGLNVVRNLRPQL